MKRIQVTIVVLIAAAMAGCEAKAQQKVSFSNSRVATVSLQNDLWSLIEYPEGQEVVVDLVPTATASSAKGKALVMRGANGVDITLDLTGLAADETYHVYAIDSLGNATSLGTLTVNDGTSSLQAQTALTKFMIVISPKDDLVSFSLEMTILLRSLVPDGYKVIARSSIPETPTEMSANPKEEAAVQTPEYDVPLLGIASLRRGSATQMKARLFEEMGPGKLNVSITPRKKGSTQIKITSSDLKPAPENSYYIVWALSGTNTYALLGNLTSAQGKVEASVSVEDFGLFITIEDSGAPATPTGKMVAMIVK
jgi:hypothetical protein